jgi:hypothetical protein
MFVSKIENSRIIKIEMPVSLVRKGSRFFFPAQLDLLGKTITGIKPLYKIDHSESAENPNADLQGSYFKDEINNFVLSFSDNVQSNDRDTFAYYNICPFAFSFGDQATKTRYTTRALHQRLNFSRSYIQAVSDFALRNRIFYLQIFYV